MNNKSLSALVPSDRSMLMAVGEGGDRKALLHLRAGPINKTFGKIQDLQ